MNYDLALTPQQVAALAEWVALAPHMGPVRLAAVGQRGTVEVEQGDERIALASDGTIS